MSIRELVRKAFVWVRYLRKIKIVKYTVFAFLLILMLVGARVATIPLQFPEALQLNDKLIHVVVFFGFAFITDLVSSREPFWLWKALPLITYGFGIEVLQYFTPDRSFSLLDGVADAMGVLLYWSVKQVLYLLEQRRSRLI
ncbi:MAG: VanZ family protein [Leucothrix sp.]